MRQTIIMKFHIVFIFSLLVYHSTVITTRLIAFVQIFFKDLSFNFNRFTLLLIWIFFFPEEHFFVLPHWIQT